MVEPYITLGNTQFLAGNGEVALADGGYKDLIWRTIVCFRN